MTLKVGTFCLVTLNWTGTLKGDEIAFERMAEGSEGQAQKFVLKRQK
jgi:hypothetical protein